jgi:uncharacterized membrane protein YagU involved in acid resistance
MSTVADAEAETEIEELEGNDGLFLQATLAGLAAGLVFGLVIQFVLGRMTTIGALFTFGTESLLVGWLAHAVNSVVFALVYALVTRVEPLSAYADRPLTGAGTGAVYGFALWFVNIGFVWPVWLNSVGVSQLPVPNFGAVGSLGGHLLWGVLLGALFALLLRQ